MIQMPGLFSHERRHRVGARHVQKGVADLRGIDPTLESNCITAFDYYWIVDLADRTFGVQKTTHNPQHVQVQCHYHKKAHYILRPPPIYTVPDSQHS
jgi:hypothetical protein